MGHIKKLKLWDKNPALEKLGKYLKLWRDRLEIEATVGLHIIEKIVADPHTEPVP